MVIHNHLCRLILGLDAVKRFDVVKPYPSVEMIAKGKMSKARPKCQEPSPDVIEAG